MKYFSIEELCESTTADRKRIDNSPSKEIREHLTTLVDEALDDLRETWGSGIRITSGYRCKKLNTAIGGSRTSAHMSGYAADTKPCNGKMADYQKCVLEWAKTHKFDQIIIEYPTKYVARWIHIGIKNGAGKQRGMIIYTPDGRSYPPVTVGSKFYKV